LSVGALADAPLGGFPVIGAGVKQGLEPASAPIISYQEPASAPSLQLTIEEQDALSPEAAQMHREVAALVQLVEHLHVHVHTKSSSEAAAAWDEILSMKGPSLWNPSATDVMLEAPSVGVEAPSVGVEAPSVGVEAPSVGVESPSVGVEAPSVGVEAPSVGVEAPSVGVEAPSVGVEAPSVGVEASANFSSPSNSPASSPSASPSASVTRPNASTRLAWAARRRKLREAGVTSPGSKGSLSPERAQ